MTGSDFYTYVLETFKRTDKSTEVYNTINDVIDTLIQSYPFEDYKTAQASLTIASGYSVALPSDFEALIGEVILVDGTYTKPLNQMSRIAWQTAYSDVNGSAPTTGFPSDCCIYANKLFVGPKPQSFDYSYKLDYTTTKTTVTSGTANVPFSTLNRKMLKHFVLEGLYTDLEEFELASQHKAIAVEQYNILIDREEQNTRPYMTQRYTDI